MPWLETSPMDQRKQFIADFHRGLQSVTELADRFEISRKTAYKWIDRHEEEGANGLANRSRRPLSCPHETPQRIVDAVLEARRHHPRWVCVTHTLGGEYVGLEEVDDGFWDVYFGPVKLGRMNERILRTEDHKGRTVRRGSPIAADPADAV